MTISGISRENTFPACFISFICLSFILIAPLTADDFDSESKQWDFINLELDIELDLETEKIIGTATATVRLREGTSVGPTFEVYDICQIESASTPEGLNASINSDKTKVRIRSEKLQPEGTELVITLSFISRINNSNVLAISKQGAFADWHGSGWYPSLDAVVEQVPGQTRITMPKDWHSVSNGELIDSLIEGDRRIEVWQSPNWVGRSFTAGPYQILEFTADSLPVFIYTLQKNPNPTKLGQIVEASLTAQQNVFGPFPYLRYTMVEVPFEMKGGKFTLQHSFCMFNPGVVASDSIETAKIGYLTAKAWWRNHILMKSNEPGYIAVNHALCAFGALKAVEAIDGPESARSLRCYDNTVIGNCQSAQNYFQMQSEYKDKALSKFNFTDEAVLVAKSKGSWVYYMLNRQIGDKAMREIFSTVTKELPGQYRNLSEFREILLREAPEDFDMELYLLQWFDVDGAPELALSWKDISSDEESKIEVTIEQKTWAYDLPVEIGIETNSGMTLQTVHIFELAQTFRAETDGKPIAVHLDPNFETLMYRKEFKPVTRIAVALVFLGGLLAGLIQAAVIGFKSGTFFGAKDLPWGTLIGAVSGLAAYWIEFWAFGIVIALMLLVLNLRLKRVTCNSQVTA